jgi:aryl-alcohol dehydrogenase-like predicted oxidoreductase
MMEYRTLGNTGLLVSRLCLGTMTFSGEGFFKVMGTVDQKGADELVKASFDTGINFFDTADEYSTGESEVTLGQSFKNLNIARKDYILATKVYSRIGYGYNDVGATRKHIMDGIEGSLKRLQTDYIDLYQIHGNDAITPVEETLYALDTLVRQGKVRYIGVSNWAAWKIEKALSISRYERLARFETNQSYYSIAGRDVERELLPMMEAEKLGLLVWSPLAGGLLSGKFSRTNQKPEGTRRSEFDFPIVDKERAWNVIDVLTPIAQAHHCSIARISLAWLLAQPMVTSIVLGAKHLDQLKDNVACIDIKLTPEELKKIDEVSGLPAEYPGWMIAAQSIGRLAPPTGSAWSAVR